MAESATEKGVNEISAGEKNLDKEFKENSSPATTNTHINQQRNLARKDKKKQRQNKKKGKQQ